MDRQEKTGETQQTEPCADQQTGQQVDREHPMGQPAGQRARWGKPLLVMLAIAAGVELLVFNFPFWRCLLTQTALPFSYFPFNPLRMACTWGLMVFCYAFRPRGRLMAAPVGENPALFKRGLRIVVVCAMVLVFAITMINPWYLGISAFSGNNDKNEPVWYNENAQREYDELADAFIAGKASLPDEVPQWLTEMSDPYDMSTRDAIEAQTGEKYYWDAAYHDGKYYVYFGAVPCLIYFVPFHLITGGAGLPTGIPIDISIMFYIAGLGVLLSYVARRCYPRARVGTSLLALIGAIASSGLLLALMYPSLYQIPVTTSMALAVWGLYFWLRAVREDRTGFYAVGSLLIALIVGCRPPLAAIAVFGLIPLLHLVRRREKRGWGMLAFLCPVFLVAGAICLYNAARFGSPLDFGAAYNLTAVDFSQHHFSISRIPLGLYNYVFQPPVFSGSFPFLQASNLDAAWAAGNYIEAMPGGVLASFPFLWTIALFWLPKHQPRMKLSVIFLVLVALIVVIFDTEFGGMVGRYQIDFSFIFALAAALVAIAISGCGTQRRPFDDADGVHELTTYVRIPSAACAVVLLVLVVLTLAFCVMLMVFLASGESYPTGTNIFSRAPWVFEALRHFFQFWG